MNTKEELTKLFARHDGSTATRIHTKLSLGPAVKSGLVETVPAALGLNAYALTEKGRRLIEE